MLLKKPSDTRKAKPRGRSVCRRSRREVIIGVRVSEMIAEMAMDTAKVTANSRNSRPTMPPMTRMGMKTASRDTVIETMVNPICRAPLRAATSGVSPASTKRETFSVTTMASSTTKPVAMVSAISDRLFRL